MPRRNVRDHRHADVLPESTESCECEFHDVRIRLKLSSGGPQARRLQPRRLAAALQRMEAALAVQ